MICSCSFANFHRFTTTHPVPITELKIRKVALKRPSECGSYYLAFNTTGLNGELTYLSFAFRDVIIRLPIISCH